MKGTIYKGIGGFYYIKTADGEMVECKPRGIFRKRGIKPLAGDVVKLAREAGTVFIDEIQPRKNSLVRPPVANVDQLFIIASTVEPVPSTLVIDKLAAMAYDLDIRPILLISKPDLASPDTLLAAYRTSGIPVLVVQAANGSGVQEVKQMLAGQLSVFCGNSGVGKSTLLNALLPEAERDVGEISQKLGRGRHTTREVEIFEVADGLVADTPGFASLDLQRTGAILSDNMQLCFPEIKNRIGQCKFSGCAHTSGSECAVRKAVANGEIAQSRYDNYVTFFEQARENERR